MAKNLTLALDDRLIERARQYAYARDLSLNGLIRKLLVDVVDPADAAAGPDLTFRLMDEAQPQPSKSSWQREELYNRSLK